MRFVHNFGAMIISALHSLGEATVFTLDTLRWIVRPPFRIRAVLEQMQEIGYNSIPIVAITALSTGAVLAIQSYIGFKRFGAESMVGTVVALSMTRELGPVLTGIVVAGRAGSAMAAELGTMKVTEQIDALFTLSANPVKYLIVPRIIAATLMLPILVILADMIGIAGGASIGVGVLDANPVIYMKKTFEFLQLNDIYSGLFKSMVFGLIIAAVSCFQGVNTDGGAEGVGKATTRAVVVSTIMILLMDYVLTSILF